MRWNAVLYSIKEDRGVLCLENEESFIQVPLKCLPKECRIGDVFEIDICFSPFKTLKNMENCIKKK